MNKNKQSQCVNSHQRVHFKSIIQILILILLVSIPSSHCNSFNSVINILGATLSFVGVESDPSTVQSTSATLKVFTQLITAIPSTGYIQITVPTEITLKSGTLTCTIILPTSVTVKSCSASGKVVTITLNSALSADSFQINIASAITNPTSTTATSTFTFYSYTSSGTVLDSLTTGITLTSTVGSLTATSLVPTSQVVGDTTTLTIKLTAAHSLPSGGIIKVTFPKWNPNAASSSQLEYFQGSVSCSTVAVLQSTLSCSFSSGTLTVTGSLGSTVSSGVQVGFAVSGFRNPLSTATVSGITLLVTDSAGGSIDSGTGTITITTAASITGASLTVDSSTSSSISGIVQETNIMKLAFSSPVPLNSGCNIKVILPTQFSVTTVTTIGISGLFGSYTTMTPTKTSSDNSFSFSSCSSYTTNSLSASIIITSLTLPSYTKTTSSVSIYITQSDSSSVASITSGITYTPTAGTLPTPTITATTTTIQATTAFTVSIVPPHSLSTSSRFTLTFPSAYTLSSTCSVTSVSNVNSAATCSVSSRTVTVSNLLSTAYSGGSGNTLSLKVSSVTLPSTTQSYSGFTATTYEQDSTDSSYYSVDTFSGTITITASFGSITASVTPASLVAYATTSYTFSIKPEHQVQQNGYFKIVYPSSLSVPDYSYSQSQCTGFTNFPTTPTCVISTSAYSVTVKNGFRLSSIPSAGTAYSLTIPGIRNPLSLDATSSFKFYMYTSDDQLQNQVESGVTIQMTSSAYMKSVLITLDSYVNSASAKYTFTITPTIPVTTSHYVLIKFPTEITLPTKASSLNCYSDDSTIFQSLSCSYYSGLTNSVQVSISFKTGVSQINVQQTFRVTMGSITNPSTTEPTSEFYTYITDKTYSKLNTNPSTLTITTNTPSTLSKASISSNTTGASQYAKYTIVIYPENTITTGGGLYIVYPSQLSVPSTISASVSSVYTKSTPTVTYDKSARQILIKSAFQMDFIAGSNAVTITLEGFKNPIYSDTTDSFIVKTMNIESSTYYYIDQVTSGLVLNSPCDYPCKSCLSTSTSNCTACYSTGDLNKLQGGTCVSTCATGKFYNSKTGSCDDCTSPCLACSGSATTCTQCGLGTNLYLFNNTCQSDCPSGYVKDSTKNQCSKCTNNCQTCQYTTTTCLSCYTTGLFPYLYQQTCQSSCPSGISVPNSDKTCSDCDASCKTCSLLSTNCTSCLSHMKYDSVKHTCTSMCTAGTQIYNSTTGQCLYCDSNCATCSGTTSTCTACSTGLILNSDNTCKSSCSYDNQTSVSGVCKTCELPCAQCGKNSTTHCTKCQGDYYLYNTTCVQYCPEKYEPNNSTRQCILVGLICPSGFTVNEAGDGCIPNLFECPNGYEINSQRTACVPSPGSPVPFPFLFLTLCLSLLVLGSYIKDKFFTKIPTNLIALIGSQELLIYILMVCYAGATQQWAPFVLSLVAVLMQITANIAFYLMYKKDVMLDQTFFKWTRLYPKTQKYLTLVTLCVNFKAIKLVYSGFYGLESCLAQFEDPMKTFFRPLRMVTYFSFIFVYIPIIIADIIIFTQIKWGYQLLVLAIESFILALLIIGLTIYELRHPERLVMTGDEQYIRIKPKGFNGETMVMSGIVDIDESTLVRAKVVDEDYEVNLRKKALVSILGQVGKNYLTAQQKGYDIGGQLDKCMTKFDEDKLKLRRAFSLEEIKEEDSWVVEERSVNGDDSRLPMTRMDDDHDDYMKQRRHSFPMTPRTRAQVADPQFKAQLNDIKTANQEFLNDNVYAEAKAPDKKKELNRKKTVSRRTQTYLRELLQLEGDEFQESDLEIVLEDEAELEGEFARDLIDGVIDGLSESESQAGVGKKKRTKKKKVLNTKRKTEIPDFELADIIGEFEIDDLGNFIILRGEKAELLDKRERRVNRRGYLIDRFGNVINKQGQIIFKQVDLDSDDEIPAPFGFEKRKKNLLNLGEDGEFKIAGGGQEKPVEDDEDLIDRELKQMKKSGRKKKRRQMADGQVVEEDVDEDEESSVDSLMAESPGKYQIDHSGANEDDIIDKVTRKKVPKKKLQNRGTTKKSPGRGKDDNQDGETARKKGQPLQNLPPKRIKREDTKEIFPSLAIESIEQRKLFKIAEHIGGMANQIADPLKQQQIQEQLNEQSIMNQERLERLKQEHFKDIINESHRKGGQSSEQKLPHRPNMEKVYGNLNDIVSYQERQIQEQLNSIPGGIRANSPFSSQITSRLAKESASVMGGGNRRLRGLESIYLQKFEKKSGNPNQMSKKLKPKFRNTLTQFMDDPELLVDDGIDMHRQNQMSLMVADKLEKMQKQYMSSTAQGQFNYGPNSSMGFNSASRPLPGAGSAIGRKTGSVSGSLLNRDIPSDPIQKGNWVAKEY